MAQITLQYDARNAMARKTLDFILSLGIFKQVNGLDQALEDVKKGKLHSYKNSDELFKEVLDS